MYPRVCPICNRESENLDRGFEHISMYLHGRGQATIYLRCKRCQHVFPWREAAHPDSPRTAAPRAAGNSHLS